MANDNIQVEVLDSSSEFRPGRKGGSVNWMQLLSGVLMLVFGLVCVFCPFEVLMGISAIIAVCVIVAGGIGVASYVRYRNTLFSQSVWSLFFSAMIVLLGVLLLMFPAVGVATIAWVFGIGVVLFGVVQLVAARPFFLVGAGLGSMVGISGIARRIATARGTHVRAHRHARKPHARRSGRSAEGARRQSHGLGFEKDELRGGWSECRIKAHEGRKPRRRRA